jgi:hypothetical protein
MMLFCRQKGKGAGKQISKYQKGRSGFARAAIEILKCKSLLAILLNACCTQASQTVFI